MSVTPSNRELENKKTNILATEIDLRLAGIISDKPQ